MNILHICKQLTSRVIHQVIVEQDAGHHVRVNYSTTGSPQTANKYIDNLYMCGGIGSLRELIDQSDILVVHTTIDSLYLININYGNKPVIWNIHDWIPGCQQYLNKATSIIVPSEGYKTKFLKDHLDKTTVIYSKIPSVLWPKWKDRQINSTCLVSAVSNDIIYRDYRDIKKQLDGYLTVYSAESPSKAANVYDCIEMKEHMNLFESVSRYSTGWAGASNKDHDIDICVTNKFFMYLACGVVPITWRSCEMTEYGRDRGISIEWNGELPDIVSRELIRFNITKFHKEELSMEYEMDKLEVIYGRL